MAGYTTPRLRRPLSVNPELNFLAEGAEELILKLDRYNVKHLHRDFDKSHAGTTISLGAIPPNAVINPAMSGVTVHEVFNAGTNNRLDIGTAATTDLYGTDITLLSRGFKPFDETAVLFRPSQTDWTELKFVVDVTGSAATTGKASVTIFYTLPTPEA